MVQVSYTKEKGIKQQSGSASFTIPDDITIGHPINQVVSGNTVATIDFTGIKHKDAPAAADELSLDGKYIQFSPAKGDHFYVWFDPGNDNGSTDPNLSGTGIEVTAAAGALDTAAKIVDELVAALNGNVAWAAEFHATDAGNSIEICAKRMGASGSIVDASTLQNVTAGDGTTKLSAEVVTVQGEGSYVVSGVGLSEIKSASSKADGGAFVVLKDLESNKNHGVQKIILSGHPHDVDIKRQSNEAQSVGSFDAADEILHAVWNGSIWKSIYNR